MSDWSDKFFFERANVHLKYVDDAKELVLDGNRFTLVSVGKSLGTAFEYTCKINNGSLAQIMKDKLTEKNLMVDHWIRDHWPTFECPVCLDRESDDDV